MVRFKNIGILAHPLRPPTAPLAAQVAALLKARGIEAWYQTTWDADSVQDLIPRADMMIAIGGDGAMLRAARVCAPHNVPLLGINMGALGFLTEIPDPQDCESQIDQLLQGNYWIESRMMIRAHVLRAGAVVFTEDALNDVVISRGVVTRTIHLEAYIDHNWTTSYKADALIIATPTGSTAYALACGGPILPPELRNILIVPVAPHLSMDRPIVLSEGSVIEVAPAPDTSTEAVLTVDGRFVEELHPGDRVVVEASTDVSRFARLRERNYFYRSLLDRLEPRVTAPVKSTTHYPPEA